MSFPDRQFKILILGSNGQLGSSLKNILKETNHVILARNSKDFNLLNSNYINELKEFMPDIVINCAAFTKVDLAESNKDHAMKVNAYALENLLEEIKKIDSVLIHFSTDYVFDGKNKNPVDENDITNPLSVYGLSKLMGEELIKNSGIRYYIIRVGWLYSTHGQNFVKSIVKKGKSQSVLEVVDDQFGSPTSSNFIAKVIIQLINNKKFPINYGIYHLSSLGVTNWYNFAKKIKDLSNKIDDMFIANIIPINSKNSSNIAKRPKYVHLSKDKIINTFDISIPTWEDSLCKNFEEIYRRNT